MAENYNSYVIDASFILSFLLNEGNNFVEQIMPKFKEDKINLVSTTLLTYEVGNGLRSAVLRKRITANDALTLFEAFRDLEIIEEKPNYSEVMKVALLRGQSFYDISYFILAKKLSIKLLTLD